MIIIPTHKKADAVVVEEVLYCGDSQKAASLLGCEAMHSCLTHLYASRGGAETNPQWASSSCVQYPNLMSQLGSL